MSSEIEKEQRRRRRDAFRKAAVCLVILALLGYFFRKPLFQHNFGVVDPARVFRSAQPGAEFPDVLSRHQVASVLNLRGGSSVDPWYRLEVQTARERGVDFYDLPMSATRRPSRRELLTLVDLFSRCRYPLLIHCRQGSDRTGLASALYLLTSRELPPDEAEKAFSLSYGHIPFTGQAHLHEPIHEYRAWLEATTRSHSAATFREWLENVYPGDPRNAGYEPLRPGPRNEVARRNASRLPVTPATRR